MLENFNYDDVNFQELDDLENNIKLLVNDNELLQEKLQDLVYQCIRYLENGSLRVASP